MSVVESGVDVTVILPVDPECFVCFGVPHEHLGGVPRPSRDPLPVLQHSKTVDILRVDRCHSLAILHSPHLNVLAKTTTQEMLAIC